MILSKRPILATRNLLLPKYGTLTQYSIQRGAIEAVIGVDCGPIRFYSLHPSHLSSATRLPQVQAILDIHRGAPANGGVWCGGHPNPAAGWIEGGEPPMPYEAVLMGDFNFEVGAPEYEMIVGPMSREHGRLNHREGFVDAWVAAGHPENGEGGTSDNQRMDYCFVSSVLAVRVRSAEVDDEAIASDHQPIWVDVDLESERPERVLR